MANEVKFNINFDVDNSGLNAIQQSLQNIQKMTAGDMMNINKGMNTEQAVQQLDEVKQTAQEIGNMLQNSFNQDLGTLNISKFNEQLKGLDLNKVYNQFASIGTTGQTAFRQITTQILTTNTQLKESHTLLNNMATTMSNTIKWGVASSAMNKLTGSVQEAYGYVKSLDTSLNNIRIVTEKSSEEMAVFAKNANDAAKALGSSTTDYTNASLIYYQQGLSDEEAAARTEVTLKTANVTGQAAKEVSEQLTAVWNGYQVTSEQAEASIDILAAVAANTASNLEELSTGMSKVASSASAMGVSEEQLAAQLSTIISATRQAPESAGTALRTIYARMSTISAGGIDEEDGATLTSYTKKMEKFGIDVLDVNGKLRDMGEVVEEIGDKWDTFTREQQISLAQAMAGTRQYNYVLALFENWDEYTRALGIAEDSVGTLQQQQDTYMESTAAHLEQMGASFEDLYDSLLGTDAINKIVDIISAAASAMATFVDSIGGGSGALLALGSIGVSVFSKQIAGGLATTVLNLEKAKDNTAQLQAEMQILDQYGNAGLDNEEINHLVEMKRQIVELNDYASEGDRQQANALIQETSHLMDQKDAWDENIAKANEYLHTLEDTVDINVEDTYKSSPQSEGNEAYIAATDAIKEQQRNLQLANEETEKQSALIADYTAKINETIKAEQENNKVLKESKTSQEDLNKERTETKNVLEAANNAEEASYNNLKTSIQDIIENTATLTDKITQQSPEYKNLQVAIRKYNDEIREGIKGGELANSANEVVEAYKKLNNSLINQGKQALDIVEQQATGMNNRITSSMSDVDAAYNNLIHRLDLTKTINNFVSAIGAIGRTASAINSLNNVFDIWENQDLSSTEKMTQTFTALGMAIPMVVSGVQQLSKVIAGALGVSGGAVTAIILGLVTAFVAVNRVMSNYSTEAERAASTAESLAQANEDVADSLATIKSNIDAYDNVVETLEDCVEDTEDWKTALQDVNDAALDIINSLSGLSGDEIKALYSRDENGNIQLDREALDNYVDRQQTLANSTEMASAYGEYQSAMAQIESDYNEIISDLDAQVMSSLGLYTTEADIDILDTIINGTEEDFIDLADQLYMTTDAIESIQSKLLSLRDSADTASAKLKAISDVEISEIIGNNYGDNSTVIQEMVSETFVENAEDTANEIVESVRALSRFQGSDNSTYQDILNRLNAAGYNYQAADNAIQGTKNGNRELAFEDENGELVTESIEYWADILAAAEQIQNLDNSAEDAAIALNKFAQQAPDVFEGLTEYILNGNLENLNQAGLGELINGVNEVNGTSITDASEITADMINTYLGDMANYIDADVFLQAAQDIETGFNTVGQNLRKGATNAFNQLDLSDLTLTAQKSVADMLENALDYGGTEGMEVVQNTLASLGDGLSDFVAVADQFDWGSVSVNSFVTALDNAEIETDISTDLLYAFVQAMNATGDATSASLESLEEGYASVHKIIDGLDWQGAISADDYETLIEQAGKGIGTFFSKTLEGTYELTGSAEKFYDLVESQQIGGFKDQQVQNSNQIVDYNRVQGYDFNTLSTDTSGENFEQQIDLLRTLGDVEVEQLGKWEDLVASGEDVGDTYEEVAEAVAGCKDAYDNIAQSEEALVSQNDEIDKAIALSYDNITDLKQALDEGLISMQAFTFAEEQLYEASRLEGLDTDDVKDYAKYLQNLSKISDELSSDLAGNSDAAYDLAVQIMRMNNGVEELNSNFDDWSDILKNSSKESYEYWEALDGMIQAMSDLLDISDEFISESLILDNLDDISQAADGDAEAIDRLREAALNDIICNIALENSEITEAELFDEVANLQAELDELPLDIEAGVSIDDESYSDFIDQCNAMILDAGMTADQVNAMFSGMGYDVNFAEEPQSVTTEIPHYLEHYQPIDTGEEINVGTDENPEMRKLYNVEHWTEQLPSTFVEGETDAFAMQTSEPGTTVVPKINSITKKASGSANNYSSKNSGGTQLSHGSSGSSGGSGGSSGSTSEPKQEDYLESEIDRYHDINLRLKEISTTLSRLQTQEDKLYGQDLLDNLNAQLAVLNDQIDATNIKIGIAEDEAAEYRNILSSQGVTFNDAGYITNYASAMDTQLAYVNSVIDKYNSMSAEEQETYQDTLDAAKKSYEDFIQMITDYDTLISETIPGLEDEIQDAVNQQIQLQIQKFTMEVEIRLDMEEAEKDWDEFYRKVILGVSDDDILGGAVQNLADLLSYFNTTAADITNGSVDDISGWLTQINSAIAEGGGIGSIQSLTDQINATLNQLAQIDNTGWADVYGDNRSQALEDLQTYYKELMTQLEDVEDLIDNIEQSYLDMIDEAIDAFDEQVSQYEYINDLLNHDINLVSLIYGDDAYAEMARYYEQIEKNNNQELDFLRQRVQYAYEMMQVETDDEARKKWQEEWEDALNQLNDKVEDSVQNIIDKYTNAIAQIIDELNDAVTSGLGLDYTSEEWNLMNQESEIYLDTINAMFAIQDLQNKYLEAINSTDSITAQKKLNDLMEEQVAYLEEKENLTQYDIDRANMLYEITLKQIAIEEAQQNKSNLRLRRDSQGNYTYQYVSDEDEINSLQDELASLQNDLYNFDKQAYIDNLDEIYSVYEEFQQKVLELYQDQTLSAEERERMIALYVEYYGNIINDLTEENGYIRNNLTESAIQDLAALYGVDVENFRNMTQEETDELMTNLIPQWDSSVQHMVDTFAGSDGFTEVCADALDELNQATLDYADSLANLENAAGVSLNDVANGYDYAAIEAEQLLAENNQLIAQYQQEIDIIQSVITSLNQLIATYQQAQAAAEAATTAAYGYSQAAAESAATAANTDTTSTNSSSNKNSASNSNNSSDSSKSNSGSGNGIIEVGDVCTYTGGTYYYDSYGSSPTGSRGAGKTVTVTSVKTDGRPYPIHVESNDSAYGWLKQSQLSGYDTGGYTGDWDGGGALAVLHQKELVLNQSDTANFLTAVNLVRDIASMLGSLDTSVFNKVSDLVNNLSGVQANMGNTSKGQLEQDVHIEANFPNVTNSNEIENAFNNLVNIASMHAYSVQR